MPGSVPARVRISLTDGNGTQRTVEITLNVRGPVASDGR